MSKEKKEIKVCGECLSGNLGKKFHKSDFNMRTKGHKPVGIDICLDCGSDYICTVKELLDKAREEVLYEIKDEIFFGEVAKNLGERISKNRIENIIDEKLSNLKQ